MTRDEIYQTIRNNLNAAGHHDFQVRVQPDLYEGWRIVVISAGFEGKASSERRAMAFAGLEDVMIEWDEFLTPEESEWAGQLPIDSDLTEIPLWPEALARGQRAGQVIERVFPSELDEDLDLPILVSFYSLRGGVGRSTALAYTGRALAAKGRKVVCVDMDLEAPGLASLFGCEDQVSPDQGVAELLIQIDQGQAPDITKHLVKVGDDDLYCLPAGVAGPHYARLLQFIDPAGWYREDRNPLRQLIEKLEQDLPFRPDVILLDARTGITPMSGPLLFDIADMAVITFFPHPQAEKGTRALVRALLNSQSRRMTNGTRLTPEPRFIVSPIPASQAKEVVERYRDRALDWIVDWLRIAEESGTGIESGDITHFVPYQEILATSDGISEDREVWKTYDPVIQWIERFLPTPTEKILSAALSGRKREILNELKFSTGTAERQTDFMDTFVQTETVKNAVAEEIPLVIGRKGTGKTAIFRWLMESRPCIVAHAPVPLQADKPWVLSADGFSAIEGHLDKLTVDWRNFWAYYIGIAICCQKKGFLSLSKFDGVFAQPIADDYGVVRGFKDLGSESDLGLRLNDWLARLDSLLNEKTLVILDGLDVGFGSSPQDRQRRNAALTGFFDFWMNRESRLKNITFKVFLREDLWRAIHFENKSHLYGRVVNLKWQDQLVYFKIALKQAIRSELFKQELSKMTEVQPAMQQPFDHWPDAAVTTAWNLLVGERMKGGRTTFTRNWVWNRLADGKNDHSPRYLLQLFDKITVWEATEFAKLPYDRSIIRPRAMEKCLPDVSQAALDALFEEYSELEPFIEHIRTQIATTPIPASALSKFGDDVETAVNAGLLSVYEGTADQVERYKVPELFRHALKVGRKGQL